MYPKDFARRRFVKKMFLKIFQNSQDNNFVGVSVLIKLQAADLQLHKNDYSTKEVFLCILQSL